MNRRRFLEQASMFGAASLLPPGVRTSAPQASEDLSLNGEWTFTYTRPSALEVPEIPAMSGFESGVAVPGLWDEQLERFKDASWRGDAQFLTAHPPVQYLSGIGWYRKVIDAPATWRGRAVLLTIGWAVGTVHVWLNRAHIGSYDYCVYTPYFLDLTNQLRTGESNELVIAIDNSGLVHYDSGQGQGKRFAGGWALMAYAFGATGIGRGVMLRVGGGAGRIADAYIRPGVDLQEVACDVELENTTGKATPESALEWEIREADGRAALARGKANVPAFNGQRCVEWQARVAGIRPWSPRDPNLYRAYLRWVVSRSVWDSRDQRFGLRRWTHEGRKLRLNGEPIYLRGDFGPFYFPVECTLPLSKSYYVSYIRRAKEIGFNFINFAAKVCPPEMLEAADELGMVLQCGDHMTVLEPYRKHYQAVWTPIVRWTRNSPSMSIYGFGGERNYYEGIIEQYQAQHDLIKSLHPESLVMPQQAIRGIDYAFDAKGEKELALQPFPHHPERLARYRKTCDLYGHYSGGAFGYEYFQTAWREMERRFTIYDRPLIAHELYMGASHLKPSNAKRYTGRVPPHLYAKLERDLVDAGLASRWPVYHNNSSRLQAITKKYCVEKTRKCDGLAGFEFLGMIDQHHTMGHYTTGVLDEFLGLKPGDTVEQILRYNSDSVVLLDFAGQSINRSYWAGDSFEADVLLSLYGGGRLGGGRLEWILTSEGARLLGDHTVLADVPLGTVSRLRTLKISWPEVRRTTRVNLAVLVTGAGREIANDWDFWVFPRVPPPEVRATADPRSLELLRSRYTGLTEISRDSGVRLRILSELGKCDITHLENGGDVLLLGEKPFPVHTAWRTFRPGLGGRYHHNVGTVIAKHPVFEGLPNEGWGDWHFYPVLEGASCVLFSDKLPTEFDPLLEIISCGGQVRKQAAIFEKRVGRGRLLVSTCTLSLDNPSCLALADAMLRYVQSGAFQPRSGLQVSVLAGLVGA